MSEHPTDPAYEETRRKAEQSFYRGFDDWLQKLGEEGARLPLEQHVSEWVTDWGEARKTVSVTQRRLRMKFMDGLGELCSNYAKAELRAFAELLQRRGIPPSQIASQLEKYAEQVLKENYERKWKRALDHIHQLNFDVLGYYQEPWRNVQANISRFLREELEPEVWFRDSGQAASSASEEGRQRPALQWDLFICHASEDKENFVRPLAEALQQKALKVWYDEITLKLGDSLRESIDRGLQDSRFGVVVLSHNFFAKDWPQRELDGLEALEKNGRKVILPIWHNLTRDEVCSYSPTLAGRYAALSSDGIASVVTKIFEAIQEDR